MTKTRLIHTILEQLEKYQGSDFKKGEVRRVVANTIADKIVYDLKETKSVVHLHNGPGDRHCGTKCTGECVE
jgi:nucleoid DNA-binding protein